MRARPRVVLLALALAAPAAGESRLPLGIDLPGEGDVIHSPVPWIELTGRAGVPGRHDVALVLDFSGSTLYPSGYDLDGDGDVGQRYVRAGHRFEGQRPSVANLDPDTILGAELAAAKGLIATLAEGDTRIGLVQFARKSKVISPLLTPDEAVRKLGRMRLSSWPDATHLDGALERSLDLLVDGERWTEGVDRRSVLVVTDGFSQRPATPAEARPLAERLASVGAAVHVLVIASSWDGDQTAPLEEITATTGGSLLVVSDVRDLPVLIQQPELSGVERLRILNETTGNEARALRIFPNGDYDAFVALTEGENRLRVEADAGPRGVAFRTRTVRYEPRPPSDGVDGGSPIALAAPPDVHSDPEEILELMRRRTLELRLFAETRRGTLPSDAERHLDVEVDLARP